MLPLICGSSAFSKSRLNIWNFWVHVLLKAGFENFENYFAWIWNECDYAVFEHSLALPFFGTGTRTYLFHCCVFQICWHIECSTLAALSFRIWNSSAGIPSPPLALPFPGGSDCEESSWNAGDLDSISESGRSSGEGNGNPLQHSCLENPMDGRARLATVHGVMRTRLSD